MKKTAALRRRPGVGGIIQPSVVIHSGVVIGVLASVLALALALDVVLLGPSPARAQGGIAMDGVAAPGSGNAQDESELAVIETRLGTMTFRLLTEGAPETVANFKRLVRSGFYDGKPFYRIVAGHVIQGGDGGDNNQPTVKGEFGAHDHVEGALGLARDADPDSGSTEIYVCLAERPHLDGSYAVFGMIEGGVAVLRAIGAVPVVEQWDGKVAFHKPVEPVLITRAYLQKR